MLGTTRQSTNGTFPTVANQRTLLDLEQEVIDNMGFFIAAEGGFSYSLGLPCAQLISPNLCGIQPGQVPHQI